MMSQAEKFDWLKQRIGKTLWRTSTDVCTCAGCAWVEENGLQVMDEEHAQGLSEITSQTWFDTKEERDASRA